MQVRRSLVVAVAALAVLASGCTSKSGGTPEASPVGDGSIEAHGGTSQIWLLTEPNTELELVDAKGEVVPQQVVDLKANVSSVDAQKTDAEGALVIREVKPGKGYVVRSTKDHSVTSKPITVTSFDEHPDQSFYDDQKIEEGYGYLTTRDGTKLAINVTLPGPIEDGPYPTVIEYSGYDPANPSPGLAGSISSTTARTLGFASVGVNIRGSGCSGGAFQLWEDSQAVDGYDVVETIAAQPWVKGNKVGMVGISYPATGMLYAAQTQPPHLAALAPMASYDDGFRALLWPGGIQNKGFARSWVQERDDNAEPLAEDWAKKQVDEGDETCKDNMRLRGQNLKLSELIDSSPYFPLTADLGKDFAPYTFVDKIDVPTFMVASFQDEQVGGHAATMIPNFTKSDPFFATLVNGYHAEGLANPEILQRWAQFLELYVADEVPDTSGLAGFSKVIAGQVIHNTEGANTLPWPEDGFDPEMSLEEARTQFSAEEPKVRVLFENGASPNADPGMPLAAFEENFDDYPVDAADPTTWYLGPDHSLTEEAPTAADDSEGSYDSYTSDPSTRPEDDLPDGEDSWEQLPAYQWEPVPDENSASYTTPALTEDTVMVGSASANLWVRSSEQDTDLQVTITEVRPDGQEMYVQSGWMRASKRKLDEDRSTVLQPLQTMLESDAEPMPEGEFVPVRVEVYPFAHAFRSGSKIRVIVSAPGGDRPVWSFVNLEGTQENDIAHSEGMPSAVVFPVVPGIEVPTPLPECPSVRGQPCRPYVEPQD